MASDANTEEPTMEEILASIRRIISDDGDEEAPKDEAPKAAAPKAEAAPKPEADEEEEDVLDLTDVVPEEDAGVELGQDDVDSLFDEPAAPAEPEPEPEPDLDSDEDVVMVSTDDDDQEEDDDEPAPMEAPLLSEEVASRASTSFMSLARSIKVTEPGVDPRSLEHLVQELLRPMLRDWLDEHLPSIVERLVQTEIDRVARKGRF